MDARVPRHSVIGVDFDNTIVGYDDLLHRLAVEAGYIPAVFRGGKKAIRDHIRTLPDGDTLWQQLQAEMYGPRIGEAIMWDGVADFFQQCRDAGSTAYVVSHKTPHSNLLGGGANFHDAATGWLRSHGFFDRLGLTPDRVFYEPTREQKVARVAALGCSVFVDDLEETFLEPTFPTGVERILFSPHAEPCAAPGVATCTHWADIRARVFA